MCSSKMFTDRPRHNGLKNKKMEDESTFDEAIVAITCADAVDMENTTTTDIFNEIIYTATNVSTMCTQIPLHLLGLAIDGGMMGFLTLTVRCCILVCV